MCTPIVDEAMASPTGSVEDCECPREVGDDSGSCYVGMGAVVYVSESFEFAFANEGPATFLNASHAVCVPVLLDVDFGECGARVAVMWVSIHDHSRNEACAKGGVHGIGPKYIGENSCEPRLPCDLYADEMSVCHDVVVVRSLERKFIVEEPDGHAALIAVVYDVLAKLCVSVCC